MIAQKRDFAREFSEMTHEQCGAKQVMDDESPSFFLLLLLGPALNLGPMGSGAGVAAEDPKACLVDQGSPSRSCACGAGERGCAGHTDGPFLKGLGDLGACA